MADNLHCLVVAFADYIIGVSTIKQYVVQFSRFFSSRLTIKKGFIVLASFVFAILLCLFSLAVENPAASEVYSADSVLLGRFFIQERSNLQFKELPSSAINALLATEDVRFYHHGALDTRSLGRVFFKSFLLQQDASGGGSTLTQQLAKNLYPRRSHRFASLMINKIREMIIASRLESVYSKNEILTLYLNTISFGDNTFGLEAAAQRFFSVRATDLRIEQAAVLIGMLKATHYYNPRLYPEQSLSRRNVVLSQMNKYNLITSDALDSLNAASLDLKYNSITQHSGLAPYFRDYIREELLAWCEHYNATHEKPVHLYSSGLKIYTTIDSRLQKYAEQAVADQMTITQKNLERQWRGTDPLGATPSILENAIRRSAHYQSLKEHGMSREEILKIMTTGTAMTILTTDGEKQVVMSPVDSLKHYLKFLNAGFFAMDPKNGSVRAWVGGINHEYFQFDHVRKSTRRQVGSTFKPIVYAAALERGVKPCDFIPAEKTTYTNMEGWAPKNSEENYGLKYSMPGALAYSVNTVSVRVLEKGGIDNTIKLARRMGIESPLPAVPSLALGSADISLMEMVSAYTAFANNGKVVKPFYITAITTQDRAVLEQFHSSLSQQALSAGSAQLILHMLQRAVNEGTSSGLRSQYNFVNDIAGKTGTTQSNTDGWFMAITPNLVTGTWVGADIPQIHFRSTVQGQGAKTALPIFAEFLKKANKDATLNSYTRSRFPSPTVTQEHELACASFKEDTNLFKKIFGSSKKEKKREFGKKKKSFLQKLFKRG